MITARRHVDAEAARRCLQGQLVAEELSPAARDLAVAWLHARGLPDVDVAATTRMSTYTAARIRARLNLPANPGSRRERCGA